MRQALHELQKTARERAEITTTLNEIVATVEAMAEAAAEAAAAVADELIAEVVGGLVGAAVDAVVTRVRVDPTRPAYDPMQPRASDVVRGWRLAAYGAVGRGPSRSTEQQEFDLPSCLATPIRATGVGISPDLHAP